MKKYFAIGDVHGKADMLTVLLDAVLTHIDVDDEIVFLGDYVDRGENSRLVVERVMNMQAGLYGPKTKVTALRGNHEQMMIEALKSRVDEGLWLINGGHQTVSSYVRVAAGLDGDDDWRKAIPWSHADWLRSLPTYYLVGDFCFVHAGLLPGTTPEDDRNEDARLWIREPFLDDAYDFGPRVVHGHTPGKIYHGKHRTGIDTGACFYGSLTCGVFTERDAPTKFISVDDYLDVHETTLSPPGE